MKKHILNFIIGFTLFTLAPCAFAQSATATLSGTVIDPQNASVNGATVKAVNTATNLERKTATNSEGFFLLPLLPPGNYTLNVEQAGFASIDKRDVILNVGEQRALLIQLKVSSVSATVNVTTSELSAQTQSAEVSGLISGQRVRELPLNGENFQQLVNLAVGTGGVIAASGGITNPSVSGARPVANSYSIDGVAANDERTTTGLSVAGGAAGLGGGVAPNLISTEALQEFRVITSNADATFGRGSGGSINLVTKSGSNTWHGAAYEYLRNDALDARNFFNRGPFFDTQGRAKVPPFRQHLFGGSFGGRIVPDKHFFFGNYEGFRQRLDQTITATVPNADLIGLIPGDLGRLFRTFYLDRGIVAPNRTAGFTALTTAQRSAAVTAGFNAALFDGATTNGEAGTLLISDISRRDIRQDAFLIRTDHQFTDRFTANFRYAYAQPTLNTDSKATTGTVTRNHRKWQQGFAQFLYQFSSRQLLEMRGGLNRTGFENGLAGGVDQRLTAIGVSDQVGLTVRVNGTALTALASNAAVGTLDNQTVPQLSLLHTYTRGALSLRSGFDLRQVRNKIRLFSTNPAYTFNAFTGATGLLGASPAQTQAVAATAAGTIYGLNGGPAIPLRHWQATEQEYFAQADWRVRRDVTLNLGVRYSEFGVYRERDNLASNLYAVNGSGNLVPNVSPFAFGRTQNRLATISDDVPLHQRDLNNWQPRLGVAWDVKGKGLTVLRVGYGIYFDRFYQLLFSDGVINPPYAVSTSATNVAYRLGQPFPVNANLSTIYVLDQRLKNPMTQRLNLAVEQRLDQRTSITVAFVGALADQLFRWNEINAEGLTPQAARPDQRFSDMRFVTNASRSDYASLQISAQRRLAANLDFTVAYTYARSRDDFSSDASFAGRTPSLLNLGASAASGFQGGGALFVERPRKADYGPSDFDLRHSLAISHIYDLPFGRGQKFLSSIGSIGNVLLGGFSLRGIFVFRSGEPFNITLGNDANDDGSVANDYPRLLSGNSVRGLYANGNGERTQYLLPPTAAAALLGTPTNVANPFDNVGRNAFRSPNVMFYDLSLAKQVAVRERLKVGFEINAFNVFNRVNFAAPIAVLSSSSFGQVTTTRAGTNPRQLQLGLKLMF